MVDPDGGRTTYAYNAAGRMSWLENWLNERTTWAYDNLGRSTEQQLASGSKATYTYDGAGRLVRLANFTSAGTIISSFDYSCDNVGNRATVVESNGDRVTWSYDNTYQVTREQRSGAHSYDSTFTYDAVGNRLVQQDSGTLTTYTYLCPCQLVGEDFLFLGTPSEGRALCCLPEVGVSVGECFALAS